MSKRAVALTDAQVIEQIDDIQTLALTMLGEARGEEIEGRIAVACVIRNRVLDQRWPDDYKGVCLQKSQFSCWNQSDPNRPLLIAAGRFMLEGWSDGFLTLISGRLIIEGLWIAKGITDGVLARDRTEGANHYLTRRLWETNPPTWLSDAPLSALIGRHAFFKL